MGIISRSFTFILGTMTGIYLAQNYDIPNVEKVADSGVLIFKYLERKYRKPKDVD